MSIEFYYVAAALCGVLSAARITRLMVADDFPPAVWLRIKVDDLTHEGPWSKVVHCGWCFGPYATALVLGTGVLSHLHWAWWLVNGWLAASYLASLIVYWDEG